MPGLAETGPRLRRKERPPNTAVTAWTTKDPRFITPFLRRIPRRSLRHRTRPTCRRGNRKGYPVPVHLSLPVIRYSRGADIGDASYGWYQRHPRWPSASERTSAEGCRRCGRAHRETRPATGAPTYRYQGKGPATTPTGRRVAGSEPGTRRRPGRAANRTEPERAGPRPRAGATAVSQRRGRTEFPRAAPRGLTTFGTVVSRQDGRTSSASPDCQTSDRPRDRPAPGTSAGEAGAQRGTGARSSSAHRGPARRRSEERGAGGGGTGR